MEYNFKEKGKIVTIYMQIKIKLSHAKNSRT